MGRALCVGRRVLASLLAFTGIALAAFHAWLLTWRLADGQFTDPVVALRWILAGVLIASLVALRRAGVPVVFSRQGAIVWLLVALLHGYAGTAPVASSPHEPDTTALLFVLPGATAGFAATALLLATCFGDRSKDRFIPAAHFLWLLGRREVSPPDSRFTPGLASRAPPPHAALLTFQG
jgi:hypothetical protein